MPYEFDSAIVDQLEEFSQKGPYGATMHLAKTTSFTWDAVFFFLEGASKADVNKVVGRTVFDNDKGRLYSHGTLLVFTANGSVVHAVLVTPPVYLSGTDEHKYSRKEAVIEAITKDLGPYGLRLVEK